MWIAVTGGIAEGKSTVCQILAELGCTVASADAVVRELIDDPAIRQRVSEVLGLTDLTPAAIRQTIQSDAKRRALNAVLHTPVWSRLKEIQADVTEIPLLFETMLQTNFKTVWAITCGPDEQRRRLEARGLGEAEIGAVLGWQLPSRVKVALANEVIRTNGEISSVRSYVAEALAKERAVQAERS